MLIDIHKITVDECLTMWASRGETRLGETQRPDKCLEAWLSAYEYFKMTPTKNYNFVLYI